MSKKFKIELDDDVLKKLKYEDLMLVLGIQKLSESKKYETGKSLAEIGKQSFEETTKAKKSNPIIEIIQKKNITNGEISNEEKIENKEEVANRSSNKELESKLMEQKKDTKKEMSKDKNDKQGFMKPEKEKPQLKINFQIISINHDLTIEDNINIAKH